MLSSRFSIRAVFGLCLALLLSAIAAQAENVTYKFSGTSNAYGGNHFEGTVTLDRSVSADNSAYY